MLRAVVYSLILFLSGCAIFPNDDAHKAAAVDAVRTRTKFDMDCDKVEIIQLGNVSRLGGQATQTVFGATGCGKKVSYTALCISNWGEISCTPELNSVQR
jgi:hypothetical protein